MEGGGDSKDSNKGSNQRGEVLEAVSTNFPPSPIPATTTIT